MVDWTGQSLNRDECRTPMLWDTTRNAGFTSGTPWLPVSENFTKKAVSIQENDEESLMNFYQEMIRFRNEHEVLHVGKLIVDEELSSGKVFAFYRELEDKRFLVLMNFSKRNQKMEAISGEALISTYTDFLEYELKPFEGRVLKLN
jgi:oligo-1,6-glucosidase/alpha-glucosidase